jgi:hypothetical protein
MNEERTGKYHCIVCSSLIYGFWLPFWYILAIVLSVLLWYTDSDYPCGILWPLYCPKEKGQKDKQRSTKHTHQTKDRVTRTPLKTRCELRCPTKNGGELRCSTSGIRLVNRVTNPVISHEWGKDVNKSGRAKLMLCTQISPLRHYISFRYCKMILDLLK